MLHLPQLVAHLLGLARAQGFGQLFIDESDKNAEDLTPDQTDGVTIHYAKTIDDVLRVALPRSSSEQQHDSEVREQVIEHANA